MKKALIIGGIAMLAVIIGYLIFRNSWKIKNVPPKNETILIFGDSLAEGVGSTDGHDLASLLGKRLKKPVLNFGVSGDTTRDGLARLDLADGNDPGIAIVILGGNDVLKKIPQDETFENLENIITTFQKNGAVVVLVGVRSGLIGDGRGKDYAALAEKTGSVYVSDILQDVFADSRYMSDAVHPNDAGYAKIAERLIPIIIDIYKKSD